MMTSHFNTKGGNAADEDAAMGVSPILEWESQSEIICQQITSHHAPFKIILKTKDEPEHLSEWMEHHSRIVGKRNIIIADNMSNSPEANDILYSLRDECTIFKFTGLHNNIHIRNVFRKLYESIATSSQFHMVMDTDERLIWVDADSWIADERIVEQINNIRPFKALPGLIFNNYPESRETFAISMRDETFLDPIRWGKPVISSDIGYSNSHNLHNSQYARNQFPEIFQANIATLHYSYLFPTQRMKAHKNKLIARGLISESVSLEEIAQLPDAQFPPDGVSSRCRSEIAAILARLNGQDGTPWGETNPAFTMRLAPNGTLSFGSEEAARAFADLRAHASLYLDTILTNTAKTAEMKAESASRQDAPAESVQARIAELTAGMLSQPDKLDQYGDPTFRKELMRLLLAQGRWDEAEALVPEPGAPDAGGWHHILFARAHQKAGDKDAARTHWQAFLETHPGHAEAVAALNSATISRIPRPTLPPGMDPKAPLLPRMTDPERDMFQRALEGVENFLEFGAGGSTTLAARAGVKRIASVESDVQWLDLLAQRPEIAAVDFTALHIDIGPTGAWGMPRDPASAPKWPAYHQAVWRKLAWQPDLVLVDGRFRVACALATILNCAPDTKIVIHDFWDRPQYHVVLRYLETLERTDTLGVFRAKPTLVMKDLVSDLLAHACNPA
ncbi:tetratricopeptide repeat protein [Xanthobacter sediminis]|uniref:tetratricopeptide repeat protein n=1 Tax=Xanthobacter sediminis TaxID=3119926 RepID=UPI003728EC7D